MKTKGNATYWGQDFLDDTDINVKRLLGMDLTLETGATDGDETHARQEALDIIQDPDMQGLNARQLMLRQKHAHGSGRDPEFPEEEDINRTHREARQKESGGRPHPAAVAPSLTDVQGGWEQFATCTCDARLLPC